MTWVLLWIIAGLVAQQQPLRLVIDVPAYRLDAFVNDSLVQSSPIAVGMNAYRTPRGRFAITRVEWNPWWIPPDRPWAAHEKTMPPGPDNPMGRVKLHFLPLYFIHGTPVESSIGSAASHGCVRMFNDDAIALARLVHRYGTPSVSDSDVARYVADTLTTRTIPVAETVSLDIRYDLVELRAGRVFVYRDIYRLATRSLREELYGTLAAAGMDTLQLDTARVRALVRGIGRAGKSVSQDSLYLPLVGSVAARGSPRSLRTVGHSPTDEAAATRRLRAWDQANGSCTSMSPPGRPRRTRK